MHRLLFWFVIKNVVPRGQSLDLANPMDICFTDLLDRCEKINLSAIMIKHIARIVNISKDHDMGNGFYLTSAFEELEIPLQKRVGFQVSDEIGSNILIGCGFKMSKGSSVVQNRGPKHPLTLFLDQRLSPARLPLILWCRINSF